MYIACSCMVYIEFCTLYNTSRILTGCQCCSLKYSGSSPGVSRNSSGMGRVWGMFSGIVSSGSESILINAHHTVLTSDHTSVFYTYVYSYTCHHTNVFLICTCDLWKGGCDLLLVCVHAACPYTLVAFIHTVFHDDLIVESCHWLCDDIWHILSYWV